MKSRSLRSNSMFVPENYGYRLKDCCRALPGHKHQSPVCTHNRSLINKSVTYQPMVHRKQVEQAQPEMPEQTVKYERAKPAVVLPALSMEDKLFKLLNQTNRAFFHEKSKICCKKGPPRQRFDFGPRLNPQSIYAADYTGKQAMPNPRLIFPDQPSKNIPQQKHSEYLAEYPKHPVQPRFKRQPEKALPEHPLFASTTYGENHNGASGAAAQIVPPWNQNDYVPDLPFAGRSVYGADFGPKKGQRAQSFKQPLRRRVDRVKIPFNTTYGDNFLGKNWPKNMSMGPLDATVPLPKGEYDTEYNEQYPSKHGHYLNTCHYKYVGQFQQTALS